jgi:glycosyltransferase involved in cell wall biosynthesis
MQKRCKSIEGSFDLSVQVQLPNEWTPNLAKHNIGVTAGVETTVGNPEWNAACDRMSAVIVPTTFTKAVFMRTGPLRDNGQSMFVVPEAFADCIGKDDVTMPDIQTETTFNFLTVGQLTGRDASSDRKNIFGLLQAFCAAFEGEKEVGLILKTNASRETKIDRALARDNLRNALSAYRKGAFPRVYMVHGAMCERELAGLFRLPSNKAFVTMTRGEGFGLPILEAAASGLPIIATNWSGYLDVLKYGKFVKLEHDLQDVPASRIDRNIFVKGAKWAQVSVTEAQKKLQRFYERPAIPTGWAKDLMPIVRQKFSFAAISAGFDGVLEQLRW